jgi:hypothetical protein
VPGARIALAHVLPNAWGPVLVIATIELALAIIAEAVALLSRRRHAGDPAVARHADPHRQRLPVLRRMVDRDLPGTAW